MRTTFLVLACLFCVNHSRRVQSNNQLQSESNKGLPDQETQHEINENPNQDSLKALATSLFAANPALASRPGVTPAVNTRPSAAQKPVAPGRVHMSAVQADSGIEPMSPPQPSLAVEVPELTIQADAAVEPQSPSEITQPKKKRRFWKLVAPVVAGAMHATPALAATAAGVNQQGAALGFFNNLRVPATLLTGTALGALFIDLKDHHGQKFNALRNLYQFMAITTVALELSCVFMSTTMGVRMLAGGFDPVATTAVAFLKREFEFEYIACRLAFFTGILSFLSLIGTRVWLSFAEHQPNVARAFVFVLLAVATFLDAFWRHTVVSYGGYFQMLGRMVYLFVTDFVPKQPLVSGFIMGGSFLAATFFLGCEARRMYMNRAKSNTGTD